MTPRSAHSAILTDRRTYGFSLIEMMVAMAIGLILAATVGYAFLGAKNSFRSQVAVSHIQENARYAFEIMARDLRMAGFTGGPATGGTNTLATPGFDTNLIHLYGDDPANTGGAPLIGYDDELDPAVFPAGVAPVAGDAISVVHADEENDFDISNYAAPTFTLSFTACPTSGLPQAGEVFVASDYTHSAVFQASAITACAGGAMTVTTDNNSGTVSPGSSNALGSFSAITAGHLYRLSGATYYIANNTTGEPSLYRLKLGNTATSASVTAEELVEGVSDMQITYGVDRSTPSDGNVDNYWTADQITAGTDGTNTIPGGNAQAYWSHVLSVRIQLTVISRQNESVTTSGGLLAKTFTTTFAIRNRI